MRVEHAAACNTLVGHTRGEKNRKGLRQMSTRQYSQATGFARPCAASALARKQLLYSLGPDKLRIVDKSLAFDQRDGT